MANDPSQEVDLQAQISSALARRSGRQAGPGGDARLEPTLGLGGMGPGSERAAPKQQSLLDDEPVGEIPPAPIHFQRDGDDHHPPRPKPPKEDSGLKKHRNWLMFLLPVVGVPVVILISLFLYLAIEMQGEGVQDSAPLIAAPEGPDKIKPTNEGGLAVEGMDSAVLNQTANNQSQTTTEQLLPPPEEPLTPPAAPQTAPMAATAGDGTAASDGAAASAVPSVEVPLTPAPATVPTTNQVTTSAATTATTAANNATTTTAPAATTTAAPATTTTPAAPATTQTATAGNYKVQLVALKSEDAAKSAWTNFQKKYPDLLNALSLTIDKIDLGGNGIFYRVQAGPLADRAAANDLCGKLGQRGQSCIVVKP
ncbi:SPOR domain-containing protein [Hypericibacter sp.]|uniref:SPOR domain-containing protein n=1 Tax=Hypericibacter sp. TaxID=2705401 RepID=UPI003D6D88AF